MHMGMSRAQRGLAMGALLLVVLVAPLGAGATSAISPRLR